MFYSMPSSFRRITNNAVAVLLGPITESSVYFDVPVSVAAEFPLADFWVTIENADDPSTREIVLVYQRIGNRMTVDRRGEQGTMPSVHLQGDLVRLLWTQGHVSEITQAINYLENAQVTISPIPPPTPALGQLWVDTSED
jgi:hypothetical protein